MTVEVNYCGVFREKTGTQTESFKDLHTLQQLAESLHVKFPGIEPLSRTYFVNGKQAELATELSDGDKIIMLPPFAGG